MIVFLVVRHTVVVINNCYRIYQHDHYYYCTRYIWVMHDDHLERPCMLDCPISVWPLIAEKTNSVVPTSINKQSAGCNF